MFFASSRICCWRASKSPICWILIKRFRALSSFAGFLPEIANAHELNDTADQVLFEPLPAEQCQVKPVQFVHQLAVFTDHHEAVAPGFQAGLPRVAATAQHIKGERVKQVCVGVVSLDCYHKKMPMPLGLVLASGAPVEFL